MAADIVGVFDPVLEKSIKDSKVLVVGAGGIGCEVLKNLVLTGFSEIEIIDLDTIDVSNLNRQFLFHKEHVGKSKAEVARTSALKFNPKVHITAYHDSIISKEFGLNFFKRFKLVINALDNRAARNHVNRMCLSSGVPLVESGTAGYEGQVELIVKGLTKCYECLPKVPQKTYPGCTIRNTPCEPIHCIVWAKHLFNQLFGEEDSDQEVSPDTADPEATGASGTAALNSTANATGNVNRVSTRNWAKACDYDPKKLFTKLFYDDIVYLLSMHDLWRRRQRPVPLHWDRLLELPPTKGEDSTNSNSKTGLKDQEVWSVKKCLEVFAESCKNLSAKFKKLQDGDHLVWDKDEDNAMNFVVACANIRAHVFKIDLKSKFVIKSMAGNIVPAIATTNAVVAGVVVLFALNVLRKRLDACQCVYMRSLPNHRGQQLVPEKSLSPPNSKCYVCSPKPEASVGLDVNSMTVEEFCETVLKKHLNMVAPDVMVASTGMIILSSDKEEMEATQTQKVLKECGVVDGSILEVDDFLQDYNLTIHITQREVPRDGPDFVVTANSDQIKQMDGKQANNGNANAEEASSESKQVKADPSEEQSDDELIMQVGDDEVVISNDAVGKKRKTDESSVPVKKRKTDTTEEKEREEKDVADVVI